MMNMVKSRAHRTLRRMARYTFDTNDIRSLQTKYGINDSSAEQLVGAYRNDPCDDVECVILTDQSLWLCGAHGNTRLRYTHIKGVLSSDSTDVHYCDIETRKGDIVRIPIVGGEGNIRDVFEFIRFIMRVIDDISGTKDVEESP
jgi:hypothetical protein